MHEVLNSQPVKPHKVRYYLERRDPAFEERKAEVLELPGFNQSSQRLYVLVVSVRQMPLQVFSSQEFCEALC